MIASVTSTTSLPHQAADDTAAKLRLEAASKAAPPVQKAATEEPAAVVTISRQGADQATTSPPAEAAGSGSGTAVNGAQTDASATPKSNKPALAYEAADTDQDGKISAYEQQSYDFRHPQVQAYKAVADSADKS
jgi:hypothetical protein